MPRKKLSEEELKRRRNAWDREYNKKRSAKMWAFVLRTLGGKCKKCGSTKNLTVDHKDSKKKKLEISRHLCYANPSQKFLEELPKCQLLCPSCNKKKTSGDLSMKLSSGTPLTEELVEKILVLGIGRTRTVPQIIDVLGEDLREGTVRQILRRKRWAWVREDIPSWTESIELSNRRWKVMRDRGKLSNQEAGEVLWLHKNSKWGVRSIAKRYGVSPTCVSSLIHGETLIYRGIEPIKPEDEETLRWAGVLEEEGTD